MNLRIMQTRMRWGSPANQNQGSFCGEVTEAAIEAADHLNPKLNALVMTNFDVSEQVKRPARFPVSGAPFYLKDVNQFTSDMPTTFPAGSLKERPPERIVNWCRDGVMPGW